MGTDEIARLDKLNKVETPKHLVAEHGAAVESRVCVCVSVREC